MIKFRNKVMNFSYQKIAKPIMFLQDPEKTHKRAILAGKIFQSNFVTRGITSALFNYQNEILEQEINGIKFKNPIGLAAGFDKNAEIISAIENIGFGFTEVGSVTAKACTGNPGKRLWRLPEKESIRVNLGLNNKGADEISKKLKGKKFGIPVGISAAKTNCEETANQEEGIKDYIETLKKFENIGDYFTINVSCPNAYGGQPFNDAESFEQLMKEVVKLKIKKPIYIKMSPDLTSENVKQLIEISKKYGVSGFICSNLTKKHEFENGGLSGKAVSKKADELLSQMHIETKGMTLIGAGGIFSAQDAYEKIKLGANLLQLITGMIYKGPGIIGEINLELSELLKKDGYENIKDAVGIAHKI